MFNYKRLFRRLTFKFVKTYFVYNDNTPKGFIKNQDIPDVVFNRDVMLVNWGVSKKLNTFIVTATPLNNNSEASSV